MWKSAEKDSKESCPLAVKKTCIPQNKTFYWRCYSNFLKVINRFGKRLCATQRFVSLAITSNAWNVISLFLCGRICWWCWVSTVHESDKNFQKCNWALELNWVSPNSDLLFRCLPVEKTSWIHNNLHLKKILDVIVETRFVLLRCEGHCILVIKFVLHFWWIQSFVLILINLGCV